MVNLKWNQVVSLNWNWVVNITGISSNLHFLIKMMNGAREAILNGSFDEYKKDFENNYHMGAKSSWIQPEKI